MYRTVIVDDDFLVRTYLKQLDSWQKAGYEIVADVRDGEEALRVISQEDPDVVVTDISMPLMDGIELIRRIREEHCFAYIIVLSCHDDFGYVKEAMKLGANEYVLKNSLDENSLLELLENAKQQISAASSEKEHTNKLIRMGSQSLKYHYFNRLLAGGLTAKEREEKRREAGIKGKFTNSAVLNMFIRSWGELKSQWTSLEAEQYSQLFLSSTIERLESILGEDGGLAEVISLGEGIFCCFLDLSSMCRSSLMRQKLTKVASACFCCCKDEPYPYAIGVSSICFGEDGIRQAYQQAREMMKLSFYDESDILYYDSQISVGRQMPASAAMLEEQIADYIAGRKKEEMRREFARVIGDCRKACVDSKAVIHWLRELDRRAGAEREPEAYARIIKVDQLMDICDDYCVRLFSQRRTKAPAGVSNVVRQALDYIHGHYKNQISLNEVADAVGLNSAYLSYLFKQEVGIGFSNYLLDCRMECARNLLKNTNYKIKDVASQSGFNDYHYFSKAFKKTTGCSPAEYRDREQ